MQEDLESALNQYQEIHSDLVKAYETVESYARENSYFSFEELTSTLEKTGLDSSEAEQIVEFLEESQVIDRLHSDMEYREYSGVKFRYSKFDAIVEQLDKRKKKD